MRSGRKGGVKLTVKKKWYQNIRFYRMLTQGFVFLFIAKLVVEGIVASESEITISPEAYCPFGGLESLYTFFTNGTTLSHLHTSNIIILGLILIITLFFRSGFCGWLCPFGTFQDLVRKLGAFIGSLSLIKPLNKKLKEFIKKRENVFYQLDKYLRYFKYLVLLWAVLGAVYYVDLVFRDYDPFVALITVAELESYVGLAILGLVIVLSLFIERPWCRYACPLGATIGIIGKLSPMRVKRDENLCINCNLCSKSCPMNIDVAKTNHVKSLDCNQCMVCIDHCPVEGALTTGLILPNQKPRTEIVEKGGI